MSLKDLFGKTSSKIVSNKALQDLYKEAESEGYLEELLEDKERFLPAVDFTSASNFARYGSAEKYYKDGIVNIYQNYPYDGSKKEKQEWRNNSSQLDLYIFDNIYPKTTGFVNLGSGTVSSYETASISYRFTAQPQYVTVKGGPNPSLTGDFNTSNIYDVSKNRESNLGITEFGNTVEFWFKDNVSTGSAYFDNVFCLFDLWNNASSGSTNYSRLLIEHSSSNTFLLSYASGSSGVTRYPINYTSDRSNWHHYAFTFKNNTENINDLDICLFLDGQLVVKQTAVGCGGFSLADNAGMMANIGAYRTDISATETVWNGFGNCFGSFDDFRFWKTARNSKQIYRNWFTSAGGGTNTDDANTDLGIYFKFNEGIVNTTEISSLDTLIVDYSGRVSNGSIINYDLNCRSTSSAIDLYFNSPLTPADEKYEYIEKKDPILFSSNPLVSNIISEYRISGSEYDRTNNANIYYSIPSWITEEAEANESNDLSNLVQIISSYFDTLHVQIKDLPKLKNTEYISNDVKPKPFSDKLLTSYGFENIDLFNDVTFLEDSLSRNEEIEFEDKLHNIKNTIYQNIFNNLSYIYKSKGTEKSLRNLIRCFGVDDELVKINLYADNSQYELTTKYKSVSSPKKFVDFNNENRYNGYIYQKNISGDSDTRSYISGSESGELDYVPLTSQIEIIFPKKLSYDNPSYTVPDFTEVSLFGAHTAKTNQEILTWGNDSGNDVFNFQVYAVKREYDSPDVYFKLVTTINGVTSSLTTSYFNDVYDNQKWNLAVRISPEKYDMSNTTNGSGVGEYKLEFIGNNSILDNLENNFNVSLSISEANAKAALNANKRYYVGAHYENFDSSYLLCKTDIKASSLRVWLDYLNDDELLHHSYDSTNIGRQFPNWKPSYETENSYAFSKIDTLALDWDFFNVISSDNNGEFLVQDTSSGSLEQSLYSVYPTAGRIAKIRHTGYAKEFSLNDTQVVNKEYVFNAKQVFPESIAGSDMIDIPDTDDVTRTKTSKPINFYLSIEKSMAQVINDEILNWFATIKDFNNLIGDPIEKYRAEYKGLNHLKTLFFEKVQNTPDFEKFLEFYKWIDSSISMMISELVPASANSSGKIRNVVESHLLERNKYQNIAPTVGFNGDIVSIIGSNLDYVYTEQKAPSSPAGTLWLKQRAERTNTLVNTPLEPQNDTDREIIRQVINSKNLNKCPVLYSLESDTNYDGYKDRVRFFGKIYKFNVENLTIIEDIVQPAAIANAQFTGQFAFAADTVTGSGQIVQPIRKKPNFYNKYEYLQLSGRAGNNKSFVDLTGSIINYNDNNRSKLYRSWIEEKVLSGSYAINTGDNFGISVAISSDGNKRQRWPYLDEISPSADQGLAYIFTSSSTGWIEEKVLSGSYSVDTNDLFGCSVAINNDGTRVVVGAYQDETDSVSDYGLAYVFASSSVGWTEEKVLSGSYANNYYDNFGFSLAINGQGNTIVVGAYLDETGSINDQGLAYIFTSSSAGWTEEKVLSGSYSIDTSDYFGRSVAINNLGDKIVIAAPADEITVSSQGLVYIFASSSTGWTEEKVLSGSYANNSGDFFGSSVAISANGNKIVVGAHQDEVSVSSQGLAYIFASSSTGWTEEKVLSGSYAVNTNDFFGYSVAINANANKIAVGAYQDEVSVSSQGLAYIYTSSSTGWTEEKVLSGSYAINSNDRYGYSLSMDSDGSRILIGAFGDEIAVSSQGLAYIYNNYDYYYSDRTLPNRRAYKNIFSERFSAPGGPEVLSRGALDNASEEYSAYNDLNTRNIRVRKQLRSWLAESSSYDSTNPSLHKTNKNTGYRPLDSTGTNTKAVYDNAFVSHQIPQSDAQYAWITGSLAIKPNTSGYLTKYPNLNSYNTSSFQFLSGAISGTQIVDYLGLNLTIDRTIDLSGGITSTGSNYNGDLNKYLNNNNGPYGYSSWKQIRKDSNKIVQDSVKNNNILSQDIPKQKTTSANGYKLYYTENKSLNFISYKQPAVTFNMPMEHTFLVAGSEQPVEIVSSYDNNKETFTNNNLAAATNTFEKTDTQAHDLFVSLEKGIYDPKPELYKINYNTLLYPNDNYASLSEVRLRENYEDFVGNTGSIVNARTYWRNSIDQRARENITKDIYQYSDENISSLPKNLTSSLFNNSYYFAFVQDNIFKQSIYNLDNNFSSSITSGSIFADVMKNFSVYDQTTNLLEKQYGNFVFNNGTVKDFISASDGIYVVGTFINAAGITSADYIAKWNGASWTNVGTGSMSGTPAFNTNINTIISASDGIYVGGSFNLASPPAACIAKWNGTAWTNVGTGLGAAVTSLLSASEGIYAGGYFTDAGGTSSADYIAIWNGTAWTNVGTGSSSGSPAFTSAPINTIISASDGIYVGGAFTDAGNVSTADYVAKWNGIQWTNVGTGLESTVFSLLSASDGIYAGGSFVNAGGTSSADYIAKWNGTAWTNVGTGSSSGSPAFTSAQINTIISASDGIYAGGIFTSVAGNSNAYCIAKWDGTRWDNSEIGIRPYDPDLDSTSPSVSKIKLLNNKLFIGGIYTTNNSFYDNSKILNYINYIQGKLFNNNLIKQKYFINLNINYKLSNLAIYDFKNENLYNIYKNYYLDDSNISNDIYCLLSASDGVYAGGSFVNAGGTSSADYIAKWNGTSWSNVGTGSLAGTAAFTSMYGPIRAIASASDGIYVGGDFFTVAGLTSRGIAKWNGINWTGYNVFSNGTIYCFLSASDGLYMGGSFSNVNGNPSSNYIVKWDGSIWSNVGAGLSSTVYYLLSSSNGIYAGGDNGINIWNGSVWSGFLALNPSESVYAILSASDGLYIGGNFINAGGIATADYIVKWNGSILSGLGSGFDNTVYTLFSNSSGIYAGGIFQSSGVKTLNNVAKWDGNTWNYLGRSNNRNGFNNSSTDLVRTIIQLNNNDIIIGGSFTKTKAGPYIKDSKYNFIEGYYNPSGTYMPSPQLLFNNFIPPSSGSTTGMNISELTYNTSNIITNTQNYSSNEKIFISNDLAKYEIDKISGKTPFYNSYLEYLGDLKARTAKYSIIPEYTISDFIKTYVKEKNGNFNSILDDDYLKLDGAAQQNGYEDINNSINITNLLKPDLIFDNAKSSENINLNFKISAIKKLMPYRDFYPSERIIKLSNYFVNSFLNLNINLTSVLKPEEIYSSSLSNGTPINQQILTLLQPVMSPGILLNSIKSSIAVDWPAFICNSGSYDVSSVGFYSNTGSNLVKNVSSDSDYERDIYYTASNYINQEQNYRFPFESIIEFDTSIPQSLKTSDKNLYYLNPSHYTSDITIGNDIKNLAYPSYNMGTGSLTPFVFQDNNYKLAIHNFLAEIPNFFLNGKLSNIISAPEREFESAKQGVTYYMDVVLERDEKYKEFIADPYYEGLKKQDNSFTDGTFLLPSPDSLYGPPTRYWHDANANPFFARSPYNFYSKLLDTPAYAPYVPPYYYGKAIARISFTATESRQYSLAEIQKLSNVEYINTEAEELFRKRSNFISGNFSAPYGDNYSSSPAYKQMMKITSSVNLFLAADTKLTKYDAKTGRTIETSETDVNNQTWVIQTKFETPSINFANVDLSDNIGLKFLGGTKENDSVKGVYSYMMKGLWTTYGTPVNNGEGIKLYIQESYPKNTSATTGSLIDLCRFRNVADQKKTIGLLAERKKVSECMVMIPYTYNKNHGINSKLSYATTIPEILGENGIYTYSSRANGPYYYYLDEAVIESYLNGLNYKRSSIEEIKKAAEASPYKNSTIIKLILAMTKYVFPPHLDWLRNSDLTPFVMYVVEFTTELNKQDLSDIWQGVMPKPSYVAELEDISINHKFTASEFFHGKRPQNDTKFKIFKVKQRANINYYKLTDDSKDDTQFSFKFGNSQEASIPEYSYNWPYDFFSLVELVNIDASLSVDNFPQTTEAMLQNEIAGLGEVVKASGPLSSELVAQVVGDRSKDFKKDKQEAEKSRLKPGSDSEVEETESSTKPKFTRTKKPRG